MDKYIIASLLITFLLRMSVEEECSLSNLYKEVGTQETVRRRLSNYFDVKFSESVQEARAKAKYLVPLAALFKKDIKKLFVEYGKELNNYEDLEIILESFNYTQTSTYQTYKKDVEKFGDFDFETWN